ncbi:MAG: aminoacyltransferase [Devosiaceae bacterium]|nr:aminoacyltransferase [Devosiaceae bacterium]
MTLSFEISSAKNNSNAKHAVAPLVFEKTQSNLNIRHVSGELWDKEIALFDGVVQEQLYVFSKNRWPSVNCEPVLFYAGDEIIGGALVLVQGLPLKLGSIAVVKWGPILKSHNKEMKDINYSRCVAALLEEYDKKRRMMISILPRAEYGEKNREYEHLRSIGFSKGSQLRFPNRYFVNLELEDEAQLKSFNQKWRYHLRKSEKAGLRFEHVGNERMGEFSSLYGQMNERKKFADHSAYDDTIKALMAIKSDDLRPELFFVYKDEEIVAGAIIFKTGECAVYLYGATSQSALELRAGYFLQWNIIKWLSDNTKAKYYDLGGTDGYQGLHQFKKGMVGRKGIIAPVPAVVNYSSYFLPFLMGRAAFFARDMLIQLKHVISSFRADISKPDQARPNR